MPAAKHDTSRFILLFLSCFSAVFFLTAAAAGPLGALFPGFWAIQTSTQSLLVDACAVGGLNGALLNAGVLGAVTCGLYALTRAKLGGVHIGAYFLMVGMSFFGKNCLNVWPIFLGAYLCYRIQKQKFANHVHFALFATALAPFVSEMLFSPYIELPLWAGISLGVLLGVLVGLVLPPLSIHAFAMHKGYNLYNVGLSAGILGTVLFSCYRTLVLKPLGVEANLALNAIVSDGFPLFFPLLLGLLFLGCVIAGAILNRGFSGYLRILRHTGHGVDYTWHNGMPVVLINLGFVGLLGLTWLLAVDAPFTGPTAGALLCMVCWAGSGTHPLNMLPVLLGYGAVSFLTGWPLSAQTAAIGVCFATGLAPVAGRWGLGWGMAAGALHACLVSYTTAFHGGFNCYNGGFTSGLVAIVLVPVLETFFHQAGERREARRARWEEADALRNPAEMN